MSDDDVMFDDVNYEVEDDDEHDALIMQELIVLVEANPALYAKNWKEYAGKNFCKDLAWESIGSNLSRQMSGNDAAKLWYSIRQRFGKERRKITAALKGKSGQGIKPIYVPKWQFYNLCLFLVDHITPRKTASNYISKKNVKKITTIGKASLFSTFILPSLSRSSSPLSLSSTPSPQASSPQALSPQVPSSQTPSLQAQSSQASSPQTPSPRQALFLRQTPSPRQASVLLSPSHVWSTNVESMFSTDDTASVSSIEDSRKKETFLHVPTHSPSSLNVEECSASVTAPSASKKMLKTIQKISISTKRTVPEPDNFAKYRKKDDNLFMQAMTKQSTALTRFATKLGESMVNSDKCNSTLSSASSADDPILVAIGYALESVSEEKRFECMLEMLQVIKSKYIQQ